MGNIDLTELREKAALSFQTLAVIFLGWLASSVSDLSREIRDLNVKLVGITAITGIHDKEIERLKLDLKETRVEAQAAQYKFYEEISKIRKAN